MTERVTLTGFLLARIAEDEGGAREASQVAEFDTSDNGWRITLLSARALAECEAKRKIVGRASEAIRGADAWTHERLKTDTRSPLPEWARRDAYVEALRDLALPYADHPDYCDEWRG